jgi:hypothetical protein
MPQLPPHYHVGIIVTDVIASRARLHELLRVTWGPIMHLDQVHYRDGDGNDLVLPTTICYSTGNPALELIEEVPGTVWVRNEHSNLHHIGLWSDDFDADTNALAAGRCPLQLCGRDGDAAPVSFAYHRDDDLGVRFEIVDTTMRDAMSFLFEPDATAD